MLPCPRSLLSCSLLAAATVSCAVVGPEPRTAYGPPPGPELRWVPERPLFHGQVTFAGGSDEHDIEDSIADDTDAGFFGVLLEGSTRSGFGGGIAIEAIGTDDDLFESVAAQQISSLEIDPYFLYRVVGGHRFRMPLRLGPWIHVLQLDAENSSDEITWGSIGLRVSAEPEVVLVRNPSIELSVFSGISLAGGGTGIEAEVGTMDEEFESEGGAFGFEIGPRVRFGHFTGSISFLHRRVSIDESDSEDVGGVPTVILGFDNEFNGIALTFGGGF